jgi:hypothetical protein
MSNRLDAIFSLHRPLPPFTPERLQLVNRGLDDILQGLEIAGDQLAKIAGESIDQAVMERLITLAGEVKNAIAEMDERVRSVEGGAGSPFNQSPELFEFAKRHCQVHAAAACLMVWVHNHHNLSSFVASGDWLVLCLDRILSRLQVDREPLDRVYRERAAQELIRLYQDNQLFAVVGLQLGGVKTPTSFTTSTCSVQQYA